MSKILHIAFILFILPGATSALGQNRAVLQKISRIDDQQKIQLFFTVSSHPKYELKTNGRRIDLTFPQTKLGNEVSIIEPDDRIIKFLTNEKNGILKLSFFLRYPPKKVTTQNLEESNRFLLSILLGSPFSDLYPNLASDLNGISIAGGQLRDFSNPLSLSPYSSNWLNFFKKYETGVHLNIHPQYTLPPFPISQSFSQIELKHDDISEEVQVLAEKNKWGQIQAIMHDIAEDESEEQNRQFYLLAYTESLIRSKNHPQAWRMLEYIDRTFPESAISPISAFLRIYWQAVNEDPYLAFIELGNMETTLSHEKNLMPYITLLQAELALTSNKADRAEQILKRDDAAYDKNLSMLRLIRQADTYFQQNKTIKALIVYKAAIKRYTFAHLPFSLANFADNLYKHKFYKDAAARYGELANQLTGTDQQNIVLYKKAMSELKFRKPSKILLSFLQIGDSFPGTQGADHSFLKQIDINYLEGRTRNIQAIEQYGQLAADAKWREVREEAAFKQILVIYLNKEYQRATTLLMSFLRNFRSGQLVTDAQALLIQILPPVINKLIAKGDYLQALVLAKKNKTFFVKRWIDSTILNEIAEAYLKLALYDRAEKVYRYIIDTTPTDEVEDIYIQLITNLYTGGKYELIDEYASRFLLLFPESTQRDTIFLIKLHSLEKNNKLSEAAQLFDSDTRPQTEEIDKTGGEILFGLQRYEDAVEILTPLLENNSDDVDIINRLAECYFQLKNYMQAIPLFEKLVDNNSLGDKARYRLIQIDLATNKPENAAELLKQLAENGKSQLWKKLAQEELQMMQLNTQNL